MVIATTPAAGSLIQLSSLFSEAIRGALEPWGLREGANTPVA